MGIPHVVLYGAAYRSLDPVARALLMELVALYHGANNGELFLSERMAAALLGCDKKTAAKGFDALIDRRLALPVTVGSFSQKVSRATTWRLTWRAMAKCPPGDEWKSYRAVRGEDSGRRVIKAHACEFRNLRGEKFRPTGGIFGAGVASHFLREPSAGGDIGAATPQNRGLSKDDVAPNIPPHINYHGPGGQRAGLKACNATRALARRYVERHGPGTQRWLSGQTGISEPKLSRFLNSDLATLTVDQLGRLHEKVGGLRVVAGAAG